MRPGVCELPATATSAPFIYACSRLQIEVDLGLGDGCLTVLGSDLTHEYVATNADYRS